jgi:uncharacterized protein with FMN-binding domain
MSKKMPKRLVALSATAIASIYLAGLMSTRGAADSVVAAANEPVTVTGQAADTSSTSAPSVVVGASATAAPTTTGATGATPASTTTTSATSTPLATASSTATKSTSGYADGTYSGTGTSRFGNVTVSVTISGGTISNVQIGKVSTTFPVSQIASLPAKVVSAQSANVNAVSGATYSSQAFKQAVQQALAQAVAANSTTATA